MTRKILLSSLFAFTAACAHVPSTDSRQQPTTGGGPPLVAAVRTDTPDGVYGPGRGIGMWVQLAEPLPGTKLVAHLSTGQAVPLSCLGNACQGRYRVAQGHSAEVLDVVGFSLVDDEGRVSPTPAPEGSNLADHASLRIVPVEQPRPAPPPRIPDPYWPNEWAPRW